MAGPYMTVHQRDTLNSEVAKKGKPDRVEIAVTEGPYALVMAVWAKTEDTNKIAIVHVEPDGSVLDFDWCGFLDPELTEG